MDQENRPNTQQELGFLIEDRGDGEPRYYDCSSRQPGSHSWNSSRQLALRFHRKIDGERFIEKFRLTGATVVPYVE